MKEGRVIIKDKKVVFMINSLDGGGAERVVSTLLNNFIDEYECYLILLEKNIVYELDNRINIISLNYNPILKNDFMKFICLPILGYKLSKIIKQYNFTYIISFLYRSNYINIIAKYMSKHKVIISERIAPSSMYSNNSITSKISRFLIKYLYNKADLIIPVSKAIYHDLEHNFMITTSQHIIYNLYDIERTNELSKEIVNIEMASKSIISVGSLTIRKNHKVLIEAFSKLEDKEYKLYILGEGEEQVNLQRLAQDLFIEDRVVFLGFDNNPYKYLSKASFFVLSSNSEGFPNVLLEAMICGLPVISTDCLSGPREILAPKTDYLKQLKSNTELADFGILTPVNDIYNISKAINIFVKNSQLKHYYKEQSIIRSNDFSIKKMINEYKNIIDSLQ